MKLKLYALLIFLSPLALSHNSYSMETAEELKEAVKGTAETIANLANTAQQTAEAANTLARSAKVCWRAAKSLTWRGTQLSIGLWGASNAWTIGKLMYNQETSPRKYIMPAIGVAVPVIFYVYCKNSNKLKIAVTKVDKKVAELDKKQDNQTQILTKHTEQLTTITTNQSAAQETLDTVKDNLEKVKETGITTSEVVARLETTTTNITNNLGIVQKAATTTSDLVIDQGKKLTDLATAHNKLISVQKATVLGVAANTSSLQRLIQQSNAQKEEQAQIKADVKKCKGTLKLLRSSLDLNNTKLLEEIKKETEKIESIEEKIKTTATKEEIAELKKEVKAAKEQTKNLETVINAKLDLIKNELGQQQDQHLAEMKKQQAEHLAEVERLQQKNLQQLTEIFKASQAPQSTARILPSEGIIPGINPLSASGYTTFNKLSQLTLGKKPGSGL